MQGEISVDEAKQLAQARLDSWRTEDEECFISRTIAFEHGWVFGYEVRADGDVICFEGGGPLAVFKTGEVVKVPGALPLEVVVELLSRNWEAAHAPALAVELGEEAQKFFVSFFNRVLRGILSSGAVEARLEESGCICSRAGDEWHDVVGPCFFLSALFARHLKQMADIDPTDVSEPEAMQSGLIKLTMRDVRYKEIDGKLVETRRSAYNISLTASPSAQGEQITLAIEHPADATST